MTRRELADRAGVSERYLADLENGSRSSFRRESLAKVERALDWPTGHLDVVASGAAEDTKSSSDRLSDLEAVQQTANIRVLELTTRFRSALLGEVPPTAEWLKGFGDDLLDLSTRILPLVVKTASATLLSRAESEKGSFMEIIELLTSRYSEDSSAPEDDERTADGVE